ncbi:MAG: restriction endonuclease subunit S [Burkholderiaceae bacterium]|nr:restriction endonuclease subunit S [Burkholderiaceae bacterium]
MKNSFVKLKDVAKLEWGNTSITKSSYVEVGFPAFSAAGSDGYLNHAEFEEDGIVLSAIGARCGKCFKAYGKWTAIKNTITIIPNKDKVDLNYLFTQLNDDKSWKISGAAQPFITLATVRDRLIQLPPLAEQRRIAALLDTADRIIKLRESAINKLEQLAHGMFTDMFSDQTKYEFEEIKLGDCLRFINGRAYSQNELLDAGTPVIRIQNLNGGDRWYYSNLKLPEDKYCDYGDLLFAWSATFGPYIWNGNKSIYHYHIWKIEPFKNINKIFAFYLLQSITQKIRNASHGASMLHMTKGGMEAWKIKLPSLDYQMRFVKFINQLQPIEMAYKKSLQLSTENKLSLQHQSFAVN